MKPTKQRLSKQQLFLLRNAIPIAYVIEHVLHLPTNCSDGILRFLCPKCQYFLTATNSSTNLARCFRCQINFNPIDIVIASKNISFLNAIQLLSPHIHYHLLPTSKARGTARMGSFPSKSSTPPDKHLRHRSELTLLKDIFAQLKK